MPKRSQATCRTCASKYTRATNGRSSCQSGEDFVTNRQTLSAGNWTQSQNCWRTGISRRASTFNTRSNHTSATGYSRQNGYSEAIRSHYSYGQTCQSNLGDPSHRNVIPDRLATFLSQLDETRAIVQGRLDRAEELHLNADYWVSLSHGITAGS